MKKSVLAVAALLVLTAVGLPFWFGREAEKTYGAMLEQLSHAGGIQFTPRNYERGWLSSTAETAIRVPELPVQFIARHRISHGPLPFDRILEGGWSFTPVLAHITSQVLLVSPGTETTSALPPVTAETTIRLNGDGVMHATMPPLKTTGAQGQIFDWRGMSADISFDREWKKIRFDMRLPALSVTAPGQQADLTLSGLSWHSDVHEGMAGYFFGDGALTIGQLEFGSAAGRMGLNGLAISATSQPSGDNVNLVIRYQLEDARTAAEERFGPAQLVIEVRRLDVASLMKFKNEMDAIYRGNPPPPQAARMVVGKTLELLGALSKKAPELDIARLSFKTREGEISGQGKFVLDGRRRHIDRNPMQLLTALTGHLEISIPAPVLKHLLTPLIRRDIETYRQRGALTANDMAKLSPEAMAEIVDRVFPQYLSRNDFTRLLVEEGGVYQFKLSIRHGLLLINGQPWHVPGGIAFAP